MIAFWVTIIYVSIVMTIEIGLAIRSFFKFKDNDIEDSDFAPTVSILIPAYNEEKTIVSSVISALNQTYKAEVVVINDGSTDSTLQILKDEFGSNKWVTIIDKENGGKFDALNVGFEKAKGDWVLAVDADSFLLPNTLKTLIRKRREGTVAVTAGIGMINGCKVEDGKLTEIKVPSNMLVISQMIEYLRTFVLLKMSLDDSNGTTVISGACGFFDRKYILELGGYKNRITEDAELTLRIHENGGKVQFVSDILSYTEAPETVRQLHKQRMRWVRGILRDIWEYRTKAKTKSVKYFLIPYYLVAHYIFPWVELGGWLLFLTSIFIFSIGLHLSLMILGIVYLLYLLNTLIVLYVGSKKMRLAMDYESKWKLLLTSFIDLLYYRPLMIFFTIKGQLMELFQGKDNWGKIKRKGF